MANCSVVPFSADALYTELAGGTCSVHDTKSNQRAQYLASYFADIGVLTIVTEYEYVDADYLDDFASFYAKSFEAIPNRCRRLHFFTTPFSEGHFLSLVKDNGATEELISGYAGFVVARPLPAAPIGKSAVKT